MEAIRIDWQPAWLVLGALAAISTASCSSSSSPTSAGQGASQRPQAGGVEVYGTKNFSADQITSGPFGTFRRKVYRSDRATRVEGEGAGQPSIVILRYDRKVIWTLMTRRQLYVELPMQTWNSLADAVQDPAAASDRERLGTEQVGPYRCIKYRTRVRVGGKSYTGTAWAAIELGGFTVKMHDDASDGTVEYQNIRFGMQDPSLFEIPAGYRVVAAPATSNPVQ